MDTLVIIGIERTGTNYLCSLLNQLPEVESRFELFANVAAISLKPEEINLMAGLANRPFTDKSDPELIRYLKNNFNTALYHIQKQLSHRKLFSFKIFREHLPESAMLELIKTNHVIFVTRSAIDTYISFMKALQSGIWINQDTTSLKPNLKIEHFHYWYQKTNQYFQFCAQEYRRWKQDEPVVLRYEDFTRGTNVENLKFVVGKVSQATKLDLVLPNHSFESIFQKQDYSDSISQKVLNWAEFEHQLKEKKLYQNAFKSFL